MKFRFVEVRLKERVGVAVPAESVTKLQSMNVMIEGSVGMTPNGPELRHWLGR